VILAVGGALGAAVAYALLQDRDSGPTAQTTGPAIIGPDRSISLDGWFVLGVLLGPPVVLTAGWLWQRRKHP